MFKASRRRAHPKCMNASRTECFHDVQLTSSKARWDTSVLQPLRCEVQSGETKPMDQGDTIVIQTRVVVDGDLSSQKALSLINLSGEDDRLDYKAVYNLKGSQGTKDRVEIVRDIVAMANTFGGYIVLGVREAKDGSPERYVADGLTDEVCASLDISDLQTHVGSFVSEHIELQLQIHSLESLQGKKFALIYVAPCPQSPIIFTREGQYTDSTGANKVLFYPGDIVIRKGASSKRVDQSDMRRIISEIRRREKANWTEEILGIRSLVGRLDNLIAILSKQGGQEETTSAQTEPEPYDQTLYYLSAEAFYPNMVLLLEKERRPIIRRYLQSAPKLFFEHLGQIPSGDDNQLLEVRDNRLLPILDNLTAMAVVFIEYHEWPFFEELQRILYLLCRQANTATFPMPVDRSISLDQVWLWREIMTRVYALGALLVYLSHWDQVQALVRQEVDWDEYYRFDYWSRYVLAMASRAGQLEAGWINAGVKYIQERPWLAALFAGGNQDEITSALCQFDFLQCVYVAADNSGRIEVAYPSFGGYYNRRTEPVVAKLVTPGKLRDTIGKVDDDQLARFIRELDLYAVRTFVRVGAWDQNSWSNKRIREFLDSHPQSNQPREN